MQPKESSSNHTGSNSHRAAMHQAKNQLYRDANRVVGDAKHLASEIYEEGRHKFDEMQHDLKLRSEQITQRVYQKPISSLLIAAGVGFILSSLLRR